MRTKVVNMLTLVLLVSSPGWMAAQQAVTPGTPAQPGGPGGSRSPNQDAAPEKSKLEELLVEALKNNPDIRVAAAKLAEAEAKLSRTRVQVTQKVVALHHAILSQKTLIDVAQKKYERVKRLQESAAVDAQVVEQASAELTLAKAKLEELAAEIPALLGRLQKSSSAATEEVKTYRYSLDLDADGRKDPFASPDSRDPQSSRSTRFREYEFEYARLNLPQAEKLLKALQTKIKVQYTDMTFDAILKDLSKHVEGLSFRNLFARRSDDRGPESLKISLRFEEALPVSAVLQALSDGTECVFFVREYGILATTANSAPHGAIRVEEFLRQRPASGMNHPTSLEKNPPKEDVEGVVKAVDPSGLISISIGSDAGLAKGHTLELYRLPHKAPITDARYLGTVRVLETKASESVVQPIGPLSSPPQAGDRVGRSIK